MERVVVTHVKKTNETYTPKGTSRVLHKHLIALGDGRKGWTFSERIQPGEQELEVEASKATIEGKWYDYKFSLPKKEFTPNRKSPEDQRSIVRQHSQEMALQFFAIQAQLGKIEDLDISQVLHTADLFEKDAAGQPAQELRNINTMTEPDPIPTGVLEQSASTQEEINLEDIPF